MKLSHSQGIARWRRSLLAAGTMAVLATSAPLIPANAASPASGSVNNPGDSVSWDGESGMLPTASATCSGDANPACDNFTLTIGNPGVSSYTVRVDLQPVGGDDWDLEVYDPNGNLAGSSGNAPGSLESVTLVNPVPGVYTVAASPYAAPLGYAASAMLEQTSSSTGGPGSDSIAYYNYTDPNQNLGAEPSLGINWNTETEDNGGTIMYIASLDTLRVRFNDCTAPATYYPDGEWTDVSVPWHVTSLDPIIFTDSQTGRTMSSQLAGKTSLLGLSDDDGESWLPSQGAGINSGVDHQTVGGGPLAAPLTGGTPAYANGVYYCSQDIAIAQCGLSLDGGVTFGPAVPMYNLTQCSGLHGHVKVGPDGTAFVPNKSCGGEQGMAYTSDNNTTWSVSSVPGSGSGEWDPSIGVATDGTLYMGFGNGGIPMVSVTTDKGDTWSDPVDVGSGLGIKSIAFPSMVAGDPDRAAFAFLGTTTPSSVGDDPTHPAEWYLFVSMTFDGGATWNTANVTPGDPVQRSTICGGGFGGCDNGTRNLLDFMDVQVDKRGRPVVSYADGCVGQCVTNPAANTLTRVAKIARLKSHKGLFSAYDYTGAPDLPLLTAELDGNDAELSWEEPGNGGDPISGYNIYRANGMSTSLIGSTGPGTRMFTDLNSPEGSAYQVRATNSFGESIVKSYCDNGGFVGAEIGGGGGGGGGGPCTEDGQVVSADAQGDQASTGTEAHDILSVALSELAEDADSDGNIDQKLFAIMKVADLSTLPANTTWRVEWLAPNGTVYFMDMDTTGATFPATGVPEFGYGWLDTSTGNIYRSLGTADFGEYDAAGTIRVAVALDKYDNVANDPNGPSSGMTAGAQLNAVAGSTSVLIGAAGTGLLSTTDETVAGAYTMVGNDFCDQKQVNTPPSAQDDGATTDAGQSVVIDVLANDSDPDGDSLTITDAGAGAANGTVTYGDFGGTEKVEYTPDAGFSGVETFSYVISDGNGGTATANVTVLVEEVVNNNPPVANDDSARTPRNRAITIQVLSNDSDPDGDELSISALTQPANGTAIDNPDGSITYTPNGGFKGNDSFTYTISDGNGGTDTATVNVRVTKKDRDDDGSSDDDSGSDGSSDDGSSDDGSSDDGISMDPDNDGVPNDQDSDDDNDGVNDDQDSDDDGDEIDDEYDSKGYDEVQVQNASVPAFATGSYTIDADVDTAALFVVATGAGAEMLRIQISDSAGIPVGTAISGIGKLTSHAQTTLMGTYTITIVNPTAADIEFDFMTVRQKF